jgi:hypothetical protein
MNVLISGAGVAGPTLAFWLRKYGFASTLVESAPALRTSGYVIDFWGLGYDIAEKMGLLPDIVRVGYRVQELRIVDDRGRRLSGFAAQVFRELTNGRYITLGRSDLSKLIYDRISGSCEIIFGDSITSLREVDDEVHVGFEHGAGRRFDLVIGADGLHSRVRKLVFGPQDRYEKDLGYRAAAFETAGYRPRNELVYMIHSAPGRQVGRFTLHNDRTLFLFIFRSGGEPEAHGVAAQKAILRKTFGADGWENPGSSLPSTPAMTSTSIARSAGRRRGLLRVSSRRPGLGFGDDRGIRSGGRTGDIARPAAGGVPPVRGAVATLHPGQAASGRAHCRGVRSTDPARGFLPQSGDQGLSGSRHREDRHRSRHPRPVRAASVSSMSCGRGAGDSAHQGCEASPFVCGPARDSFARFRRSPMSAGHPRRRIDKTGVKVGKGA